MRTLWRRLSVVAMESMIAMFALYSALAGLLKVPGIQADVLDATLGSRVVTVFQVVYLAAGALMLYGIGRARRNAEMAGIILVITSVVVRQIALVWLLRDVGLGAIINAVVFNLLAVFWLVVRLLQLFHGYTIVRVKIVPESGQSDDDVQRIST